MAKESNSDILLSPLAEANPSSATKETAITEIAETANSLKIPETPAEVQTFITKGTIAIKAAIEVMKNCPANSGLHWEALHYAQKVAGMVLDEYVKIADKVRDLGTTKGKGKAQILACKQKQELRIQYGFDRKDKRFRNVCDLTSDCAEAAKQDAKAKGDIPSINRALTIKRAKNKKKPAEDYPFDTVWSDVDLSDDLKFDETLPGSNLFACTGWCCWYNKDVNVKITVANELLPKRCKIYEALYLGECQVIPGDINEKMDDIVQGHIKNGNRGAIISPVCRPFSRASKNPDPNREDALLIIPTIDFLWAVNDTNEFFIIEDVAGFPGAEPDKIKKKGYKNIGDYVIGEAEKMGYLVNLGYLDCAQYQVPQNRRRCIITGIKKDVVLKHLGDKALTAQSVWRMPKIDTTAHMVTIGEALKDVPRLEAGENAVKYNRHHIAPKLPEEIVEARKHLRGGESTTVTIKQPDGSTKICHVKRSRADRPGATITGTSGDIYGNLCVYHPGEQLCDGIVSQQRLDTCHELFIQMGLPKDFELPPQIKVYVNDNWWGADGIVAEEDLTKDDIKLTETELRAIIGEHLCPVIVKKLLQQLCYQLKNNDF